MSKLKRSGRNRSTGKYKQRFEVTALNKIKKLAKHLRKHPNDAQAQKASKK